MDTTILWPSLLLVSCARSPLPPHALPDGVHVATPQAGRYAMLLESRHHGGCSMSSFFTTSRASLVLSLTDDGEASGCRGRRWISAVTANELHGAVDPHADTIELMEQQGMRGTWRQIGDALRIDLALDDTICKPMRNAASEEARPWSLECVALAPSAVTTEVEPAFPALACHLVGLASKPGDDDYPHDVGYTVAASFTFFAGDTIFLASDPGVIIEESAYGGLRPEGIRHWSHPPTVIAFDAWSAATK